MSEMTNTAGAADGAAPEPDRGRALGRRVQIWGVLQALVAAALLVFALVSGGEPSWWMLGGLVVIIGGSVGYVLAGHALRGGALGRPETHRRTEGRRRLILSTLLSLNWMSVISFLAVVNCIMHPDVVIGGGVLSILIGGVAPAFHLIGNIWNLVLALNLPTGRWQPG